jgi:ER-bound oxygenase mpaB/B'/Rubber oxygenase, catalytic domain
VDRYAWLRRIETLDPDVPDEAEEIHRITAGMEFPWDVRQALGLALFRTYAVPSVGELLARTGQFTAHTQKRYDDTVLLLGATVDRGFDDPDARTAIRRMNQMHRRYGIGNDDMLYVLATFVVTPLRWLDAFGWRPLHPHERRAAVAHYRALARHMGIRDVPLDEQGFATLLDAAEAERFAYTAGAREVADATLGLMATFPPFSVLPARAVRRATTCLMDPHLLRALRYPVPTRVERAAVHAGMRVRALVERRLPPRAAMVTVADLREVRSYPDGFDLARLGTFA